MTSNERIDAELATPIRTEPEQSARRRLRYHIGALLLSILVLSASVLLEVRSPTEVSIRGIGVVLPGICLWQRLSGVGCPGCGLTRCFVSLAHGDFLAAWRFNPAGLPLFAFLVYQLPYRLAQMIRLVRGREEFRHDRVVIGFWGFVMILIFQWIVRTFF